VQKYVDDIVTVEEEEIANAILLLLEREKTLAEGAGAAAIAAMLNRKLPLQGSESRCSSVAATSTSLYSRGIIERGLVRMDVSSACAFTFPTIRSAAPPHRNPRDHRANIVETAYDRAYHGVNLGDTAIDITMETRGPEHIAELLSALMSAGYTHERIL